MISRTRILLFFGGITLAFLYVGQRLATSFGIIATTVMMAILFTGFLMFRRVHRLQNAKLRHFLGEAIHLELAGLSFLFAFVVLRDLIFIPLSFWEPEVSTKAFDLNGGLILLGFVFAALVGGMLINYLGPRIVRVELPIRDLPKEFEKFTIAQISDLHVRPATKPSFVASVVEKTLALRPSMVALTGDIGDGNLEHSMKAAKELAPLSKTPHVAFYVTGNHEFYNDGLAWIRAFKDFGFKPLMNTNELIRSGAHALAVAGVLDPASLMAVPNGGPQAETAMKGIESAYPKILLAHQPGIAPTAADLGYDIQLSGHTHAGQFFPWTLVINHVHEFAQGLGRKGKMWVYVNPGTGSWGPQVRLGTRTEITLLTLVRETTAS